MQVYAYSAFQSCARDLVIARLTVHHGTVLGDADKKPVPKNSPVMHLSMSLLPGLLHNSKIADAE